MSFRQVIAKYFSDHAETNDLHTDPSLQTHYYKTTRDKGFNMLENLLQNNPKYSINSRSKEHGEISASVVKGKKAFIVATVIMVRPYRTAIDFSVTTESVLPFDFGYSHKMIQQLYSYADKELPLIKNRN
ncbi:cytosolic protein [Lentibacillus sp. CBA3610]|uniref:cytosolic protein n=1 Tax=Lentibacillus sp. CBA3610 TaxID=2518176 RepID=UPI0015956F2C|nr:cytosolic protein [Lentibacillus sp. CBA3610]QKY69649.1 cytosolic protein [Lentibacillus sp. CBA3610]